MNLIAIILFLFSSLYSQPSSVLLVGGGPAGLATAIEAKGSGAQVTLIEKREQYSRPQQLFLTDSSILWLKKWKISHPQMQIIELEDGTYFGFVAINDLEVSLEKRVKELGIRKIQGEFHSFASNNAALVVTPQKKKLRIPYDIIVGADGANSTVRNALGIEKKTFASSEGAFAFVYDPEDTSDSFEVTPPIQRDLCFLRKIKAPKVSILLMQNPGGCSSEQLQKMATECGWDREAFLIGQDRAYLGTNIPIALAQAQRFSSKGTILVGDAAATASFFQGMGANAALKTAEIAGQFFKDIQAKNPSAYQHFDQEMQQVTDALIEDSASLF